jgi:hypothetical protein
MNRGFTVLNDSKKYGCSFFHTAEVSDMLMQSIPSLIPDITTMNLRERERKQHKLKTEVL